MEMKKITIQNYFDLIHKQIIDNGFFLNINRYIKSRQNDEIKFTDYPYDDLWNVKISEQAYLQKGIHFLLTQRQNLKGNIGKELLKLKQYNEVKNTNLLNIKRGLINKIKKLSYLILKLILINFFSKKKLNKISEIISNIGESR